MGRINLLDKNVAELIAAGEVVERPASIVKELAENSIDAGATAVTIEIRRGGIAYIRVTDNGSGILPEDVPLAFLRHATSKIKAADDLNFISTLGFRGEALASVAAVSRLELTTKTREQPLGTFIRIEGGEQLELVEAGCPDGTTITVRDLFYNVPARQKFLKKDVSEGNQVGSIVDKLALSHPEVSFKFIVDQRVRLHTPGDGKLLSAIHAVFGGEFAAGMRPVDYGMSPVSVKGFASAASYSRNNRAMQHFFINGRYIRSRICAAALEDAYKNSIMVGKYPSCVLNVLLPAELVDVNVSPAKTEVRFMNDRSVFDAVYFAVKSALSQDDILKKMAEPAPKTQVANQLSPFQNDDSAQEQQTRLPKPPALPEMPAVQENPLMAGLQVHTLKEEYQKDAPSEEFQFISPDKLELPKEQLEQKGITFIPESPLPEAKGESPEPLDTQNPEPLSVRVIGELFRTYLLFEGDEVFFLLDKHAAHERILYEKLKRSIKTEERQLLLQPVVVSVSPEENQALTEQAELLKQMGFVCEDFGNNTVILREVPMLLAAYNIEDILLDIAQKLAENRREVNSDQYEGLLHSIACRAAIKANDRTSIEELTALLQQVYADDEIRHCPHGRPVVIALTRREIERKFGRIQ